MVQRFRDSITELSRRLGELGPSARLLIGSLAIILAMGFFLVSQYAAGPSMSPIKVRIEDKATAISKVRELGYEVEDGGTDVILVDVREKRSITEMLENDGLAPTIDDAAAAAVGSGSWQAESEMQETWRRARVAEAEKNIRMIEGVDSVNILVSTGKRKAFVLDGPAPKASVNVRMKSRELDRSTAESIAFIALAVENDLELDNIRVVDGGNGRTYTFGEDGSGTGGDYLSKVRDFERDAIARLSRVVRVAFPRAMVSVNAQILVADISEQKTQIGKPVKAERSKRTNESRTPAGAGVSGSPGFRSNAGTAQAQMGGVASINGNPASGVDVATRETEEIENVVGVPGVRTDISQRANHPVKVTAAILLSEAEVKAAIRANADGTLADGETAVEVTAAELELEKTRIRTEIVALLEPLVDNSSLREGGVGEVKVAIMPFASDSGLQAADTTSVVETFAGITEGDSGRALKNAGLVGLALASLAMMFMMVRRSSEPETMPTVDELAGVPPVLEDDAQVVVGEADEVTPALVGVELDDEELRRKQMLDQLNELIKKEPTEVATLLRRWMRTEG